MDVFGEEISPADRISEKKIQSEDLTNIKGAQILLVEDNEINQQVAREILAGGGLKVTVANDGQEAVIAVQNGDYDVILMDIQMPVMDGYTATRRIRKWESERRNAEVATQNGEGGLKAQSSKLKVEDRVQASNLQPLTSNIPIIAMTAHAMAGDEQKSLKAGMNDHVTKPIDPDQLFASLVKWIKPSAAAKGLPAPEGPAAAAPSEHDPAVPDENDLPDSLPGFDLTAGLARIMGNKRLYRKLLLDFGANYGGAANEIRQALEAGDFEQAHSLVHNIKGLAGNLEALDLKTAAVNIEILVKGQSEETVDEKQLQDKIAALEYALAQALDAVQTLGPAAEKPTLDGNEPPWASVPPELIKRAGDDIIAAAEMGDVTQIKAMAEELKSESDAMAPFSDELIRLADDFDFDGILKMVRALDS